jgi:hypothetical protein
MRLIAILMMLSLHFANNVNGQAKVFFNSRPIDTLRYAEIKGSPYLYEEWKLADIESRNGKLYEHVLLNYNGYERKFEVAQVNTRITLDESLYDTIIIYLQNTATDNKEWFIKGLHYVLAPSFANVIYSSDSIKLIRDFRVRISDTTNELHGDPSIRKKFIANKVYLILYKSKLQFVRLSKKSLGRLFENKDLVNEIVLNNNLNLSEETDLLKFLKILDRQLYQ